VLFKNILVMKNILYILFCFVSANLSFAQVSDRLPFCTPDGEIIYVDYSTLNREICCYTDPFGINKLEECPEYEECSECLATYHKIDICFADSTNGYFYQAIDCEGNEVPDLNSDVFCDNIIGCNQSIETLTILYAAFPNGTGVGQISQSGGSVTFQLQFGTALTDQQVTDANTFISNCRTSNKVLTLTPSFENQTNGVPYGPGITMRGDLITTAIINTSQMLLVFDYGEKSGTDDCTIDINAITQGQTNIPPSSEQAYTFGWANYGQLTSPIVYQEGYQFRLRCREYIPDYDCSDDYTIGECEEEVQLDTTIIYSCVRVTVDLVADNLEKGDELKQRDCYVGKQLIKRDWIDVSDGSVHENILNTWIRGCDEFYSNITTSVTHTQERQTFTPNTTPAVTFFSDIPDFTRRILIYNVTATDIEVEIGGEKYLVPRYGTLMEDYERDNNFNLTSLSGSVVVTFLGNVGGQTGTNDPAVIFNFTQYNY